MNDDFDNSKDDQAVLNAYLTRLNDQEKIMNSNDERDYDEEQYNRHLLDDETDLDYHPDSPEVPVTRTARGFSVDAEALRQALEGTASTVTFTAPDGYRFGSDRRLHPESTWRQRAEEAEAALTAIGGVLARMDPADREYTGAAAIGHILREAGKQADRLMAQGKPPASPASLSGTDRDGIMMPGGWSVYYDGHLVFSTSKWESIAPGVESIMRDGPDEDPPVMAYDGTDPQDGPA